MADEALFLPYLRAAKAGSADASLDQFLQAITHLHPELYPAQEEAILEIWADKNVVLSTPTGSGKSLVAQAMHFRSIALGRRSFYTSPIKALVSEKFFDLCRLFGGDNVGMITGDASINREAPIICCTAEILMNMALSEGGEARVHDVIMDEFHYYSDRDRGVAWQVPLLLLSQTTFLLMSATLGDCTEIASELTTLNGKKVALVEGRYRPVPLDFSYVEKPLHETLNELVASAKAPIYSVCFTQKDCAVLAQNLLSTNYCSKEEKSKLETATQQFRFDTPYGKELKKLLRHGIGIHHAGILPKYRLLTEKLAQQGLLKIIIGTDTLGVGVNIPIRSVLLTKLCKFNGEKVAILSVREFLQISGRAGRKGFDTEGYVVVQAPEHVVENKRLEARHVANESAKKKKIVKKQAPDKNYVAWDRATFERLVNGKPEQLQSRFKLSHSMLMLLLAKQPGDAAYGYKQLVQLIGKSHESNYMKSRHRKHAAQLFKSLRLADIVSIVRNALKGPQVVLNDQLQRDFSLHHALSLYIVDTILLLESQDDAFALNVLTLVESVLENPEPILRRQVDFLKQEKIAELKAQGMDYMDRCEELDKIEYPKPLREFVYSTFNEFAKKHPWVNQENIRPKSVAREMLEKGLTFSAMVTYYGVERSEGLLLRYLSDSLKAMVQNVPASFKDERVDDAVAFLRGLIGKVDTSLIEEWGRLTGPQTDSVEAESIAVAFNPTSNFKAFSARIRNDVHQFIACLSRADFTEALQWVRFDPEQWSIEKLEAAFAPFVAAYGRPIVDHRARQPRFTLIEQSGPDHWRVRHTILDQQEDNLWMLEGEVRWSAGISEDDPIVEILRLGV